MTHLSDNKTVAKMGHPVLEEQLDVGRPSPRRRRLPDSDQIAKESSLDATALIVAFKEHQ